MDFSELKGRTITDIRGLKSGSEHIEFDTVDGEGKYKGYGLTYYQDCCASCSVEEIHGDVEDLLNSPILLAEEVSSTEPTDEMKAARAKEKADAEAKDEYYSDYQYESETWSFYKLATIKGSVTIRWYGSSNGYYSETATFHELGKDRWDD